MSDRFIKFIPGQRADWLQENYPNAFLLLTLIAKRARRYSGHIDEFEIGWALLGDHKSAGLTRQQYRTSLDFLEEKKFLEIVHKGKNDKKSTIKSTIKRTINGTIVKLIDSTIWDINPEHDNHQINHQTNPRLTIAQPSPNHEQERRKKEIRKNKEKKTYVASADASRLAHDFLLSIKSFKPNFIEKTATISAWKKEIDELLKARTPQEISTVIGWIPSSWWKGKILSVKSLTKHLDTLEMQIGAEKQKGSNETFERPPESGDKPKPRRANELVF